jgi:chromosome segregation ATPase
MLRKILVSGVGVGLLGLFFFGRDAASYFGTSIGWVKDSVKNSVPMDFEIQRARRMIKDLVPDIRANMHLIAKEEVEIEKLDRQIADSSTRLEKDRTELMRLKTDLASGKTVFQYAGRRYDASQVKADLANRFERYKTTDATRSSLEQMHQARQKSLEAARQKLENMLAAKRQLEVDAEHLDARLKMVEAAQTTSNYNFDDSQLSRAKELVADLRTRLDVAEKLVNSEQYFHDEIPLDGPTSENILEEVTEYFQGNQSQVADAGGSNSCLTQD